MAFLTRDGNPFSTAGRGPTRRTILCSLSALVPFGILGPAIPAFGATAPHRQNIAARRVFHVDDFGAKGDCDFVTGEGTDDTAAINAAIRACQAAGGGLVVFAPEKTYRLSDPFPRTDDSMGGPSIHLRPGVSLDGQGCKLFQSAPASFIGNRSDFRDYAKITADISAGINVIPVDAPEVFTPGDDVFIRLGDNGYIPIEPNVALLAKVLEVSDEGITIDRAIPRTISATRATIPNRRVYKMGELIQDISIRNFHFHAATDGKPEAGLAIFTAYRLTIENLWSHGAIGAGIVLAQFVENSRFSRLVVWHNTNLSKHSAMGRAVTFSNATNCKISHVVAQDIASTFSFVESHSTGIEMSDIWVGYGANADSQIVFFAAEESQVTYRDVYVRADNRLNIHDSGGTPADFTIRNLTVDSPAYPKALPSTDHLKGKLRLLIDGEYIYDLDKHNLVERTISLKSGMYEDFHFPAGVLVGYDTWLSPEVVHSDIVGIYLGSQSNNGVDIKDHFTPGRWREIPPPQGPSEDSSTYGSLRRLTEGRKILIVTANTEDSLSGTELRIRLRLVPRRMG